MNLIISRNFKYTTEPHITYTPCYNQYGKVAQLLNWNIEQKLLKMCGGNFKIEYLYIK